MVKYGQVWKDNDPRGERFVKVMRVEKGSVVIRRCNPDGSQMERNQPFTTTKPERFGKAGRAGFTLVKDQQEKS